MQRACGSPRKRTPRASVSLEPSRYQVSKARFSLVSCHDGLRSSFLRTVTLTTMCRSARLLETHRRGDTTHQGGPRRQRRSQLLWLDFANAFSSIPHKLVELVLLRHHVPSKVIDLIPYYYNNFRIRVTTGSHTSD